MFKTIFSTLFSGVNPLSYVKGIAIAVAMTAVLGGGGIAYYKYSSSIKKVTELTKTVSTIAQTATDLKHVVTAQPASAAVTNAVEVKNDAVVQKEEVAHQQKIVKVANKVKTIKKDPKLTTVEKDQQVAQTYISQLWSDYCDAGGDNTACSPTTTQ